MNQEGAADMLGLAGRAYVILGAGQGIGQATCQSFAAAGARLVCVDRDAKLADAIARETNGLALVGDVTRRGDMSRLFKDAAAWAGGRLAGVVDIVGIADVRPMLEMDDESWDQQINIVVRHVYLALQEAVPYLQENSSFAFVSSMAGHRVVRNQVFYGAAKAALDQLVRGSAVELGERGIRVNAVAPGFVRTPRLNSALAEEFWTGLKDYVPVGRAASPAEIAGPLLFLSSRLAAGITGVILPVDGGVSVIAALPKIPLKGQATKSGQSAG